MKTKKGTSFDTLNERFLLACENADIPLARKVLAEGARIDAVNQGGESAMHLAVKSGDARIVDFLLRELAMNTDSRDAFGRTPLHWAAQMGNIDIAETLMLAHADVEAKDDMGVEAKIYAEMSGNRDMVRLFNFTRNNRR